MEFQNPSGSHSPEGLEFEVGLQDCRIQDIANNSLNQILKAAGKTAQNSFEPLNLNPHQLRGTLRMAQKTFSFTSRLGLNDELFLEVSYRNVNFFKFLLQNNK